MSSNDAENNPHRVSVCNGRHTCAMQSCQGFPHVISWSPGELHESYAISRRSIPPMFSMHVLFLGRWPGWHCWAHSSGWFYRPPTYLRRLRRNSDECGGPSSELWWMWGRDRGEWTRMVRRFSKLCQTLPDFARLRQTSHEGGANSSGAPWNLPDDVYLVSGYSYHMATFMDNVALEWEPPKVLPLRHREWPNIS